MGRGNARSERVPLQVRRDVRRVRGLLAELLKGPQDGASRDDYYRSHVEDDGALLDPMSKLRQVYPNLLSLLRPRFDSAIEAGGAAARFDFRAMSEDALFGQFFEQVNRQPADRGAGCGVLPGRQQPSAYRGGKVARETHPPAHVRVRAILRKSELIRLPRAGSRRARSS